MTSSKWWKRKNSVWLFAFLWVACTSVETKERKVLAEVVQSITQKSITPNMRAYVLIPNAGCSGCISTAEQFMFDNVDKLSDVQFILRACSKMSSLGSPRGAISL